MREGGGEGLLAEEGISDRFIVGTRRKLRVMYSIECAAGAGTGGNSGEGGMVKEWSGGKG